jgi:hypothetical protein
VVDQSGVLPSPSGLYAVGMRDLDWLGDGVPLRAWYPAEPGTGNGMPAYASREVTSLLGATDSDVGLVQVAATLNALPLASLGARPAVIFVPFDDLGSLSTVLMLELASHGFVALVAQPTVGLPDASDTQAKDEVARIIKLVDRLAAGTDDDSIGVIEPRQIAVGGHSAGGSAAFEATLSDKRIGAVFDLDGALVRLASIKPVGVPALVVMSSLGLGGHHEAFPDTFSVLSNTRAVAVVGLDGADHFDLLDAPAVRTVFKTAAAEWPLGPIGPAGTTSTAELVVRFLTNALRGNGGLPDVHALVAGVPHAVAEADFLLLG